MVLSTLAARWFFFFFCDRNETLPTYLCVFHSACKRPSGCLKCNNVRTAGPIGMVQPQQTTSLVAWWSELLTISHEVPVSISHSAVRISGKDPHSDHDLGSLLNLCLRLLPVLHDHTYHHHSHHQGNVTAPCGRPNFRSRVHFGHNQEGETRSLYGHSEDDRVGIRPSHSLT
jgi:hypothetical protein